MKLSWGGFEGAENLRLLSRRFERLGFDTITVNETKHDSLIQAAVMVENTSAAEVMTSVAIAFARTPMLLASAAHDLNSLSAGRFILGLGSQIKPHIVRRFSMPWSRPADRMREMIRALHAIWDAWYDQKPLAFEGEFYTHTLMTPMFTPLDIAHGRPRVHLAAVGPQMTAVAAELADGMLCHPFTSERYMREVTLPAIEAHLSSAGRSREAFELTAMPLVATGSGEEAQATSIAEIKKQLAFYGSTPAYRPVLELHGWGALHEDLHQLSKQGRWVEMGELIDDSILDTLAIVGAPKEAAQKIRSRFGDICDRVSLGFGNNEQGAADLFRALRE